MSDQAVFVGIDVGKDWLDVARHSSDEVQRFPNDEGGIQRLVVALTEVQPRLVVLEATGGFEYPAAAATHPSPSISSVYNTVANVLRVPTRPAPRAVFSEANAVSGGGTRPVM